ncbi:MAG TPA: hypothetical protein VFZ66_14975 [Herpetosiphonaceae bacterium]
MNQRSHHLTHVLLRVAADLGHGGPVSEYKVDSDQEGYTVTLWISRPFPGPGTIPLPPQPPSRLARLLPAFGQTRPKPSHMTEVLVKDQQQVEAFLRKLATEFNVYELADLKSPYPFLHPTFYSFSFRDSAGKSHSFEYQIECSHHLDERYKGLIQEFDSFFESRRVFQAFFESQRSTT